MQKNSDQLSIFHTNQSEKELTYLQEDFLANLSPLLALEVGSQTPEELYFLKSKGFYEISSNINLPYLCFYSKMLKVYLTPTLDTHLLQSTEFLPTLITPLNANWLILAGFSPKTENASLSLADIMETQVEERFFLSEKMVDRVQRKE